VKPTTLYGIHYSPWTIRARWALKHHGIDIVYREHTPLLGEANLRWQAHKAGLRGRMSVPLLIHADGACSDSWSIMCYADQVGTGKSLNTNNIHIASWANRLEPAFDAGRRRLTRAMLKDKDALMEAGASGMPRWLTGSARPAAAMAARFIARKYGFNPDGTDNISVLTGGLDLVREALAGKPTIHDTFGAADILGASLVGSIAPHESVSIGHAMRRTWVSPELTDAYSDLVKWRDDLFGEAGLSAGW